MKNEKPLIFLSLKDLLNKIALFFLTKQDSSNKNKNIFKEMVKKKIEFFMSILTLLVFSNIDCLIKYRNF